jgi:hypothetical protein
MKRTTKLTATLLAFCLSSAFPAFAKGPGNGMRKGAGTNCTQQTSAPLNETEAKTLLWMREEEKLARDVYRTFYSSWSTRIFSNIARSEQRHMDAILCKIVQFGLSDPAKTAIGQFTNTDLQALYDQYVADGSGPYIAALRVGATIEDLDIRDLRSAIEGTGNVALQTVYSHLLEGSKNHLRAFVRQLKNQGVEYTPQYITQELFNAILGT